MGLAESPQWAHHESMETLREVQLKSLWMDKSPLRIAGNLLLLVPISIGIVVCWIFPLNLSGYPKTPSWMTALALMVMLIIVGLVWWL